MENNNYNGSLYPVMVESQEGTVQMGEQRNPFILGNTIPVELPELQERYCTPVFSRDNVETISHADFATTALDCVQTFFHGQTVKAPVIRCSHEMKLRTRNGAGKLVENLMPEDESSYMQRMMFMIEIPSIQRVVNGNLLQRFPPTPLPSTCSTPDKASHYTLWAQTPVHSYTSIGEGI